MHWTSQYLPEITPKKIAELKAASGEILLGDLGFHFRIPKPWEFLQIGFKYLHYISKYGTNEWEWVEKTIEDNTDKTVMYSVSDGLIERNVILVRKQITDSFDYKTNIPPHPKDFQYPYFRCTRHPKTSIPFYSISYSPYDSKYDKEVDLDLSYKIVEKLCNHDRGFATWNVSMIGFSEDYLIYLMTET